MNPGPMNDDANQPSGSSEAKEPSPQQDPEIWDTVARLRAAPASDRGGVRLKQAGLAVLSFACAMPIVNFFRNPGPGHPADVVYVVAVLLPALAVALVSVGFMVAMEIRIRR